MYEFFDHTADLGIHVETEQLEDLYAEAAEALFAVICDDPSTIRPRESRQPTQANSGKTQTSSIATEPVALFLEPL